MSVLIRRIAQIEISIKEFCTYYDYVIYYSYGFSK